MFSLKMFDNLLESMNRTSSSSSVHSSGYESPKKLISKWMDKGVIIPSHTLVQVAKCSKKTKENANFITIIESSQPF